MVEPGWGQRFFGRSGPGYVMLSIREIKLTGYRAEILKNWLICCDIYFLDREMHGGGDWNNTW